MKRVCIILLILSCKSVCAQFPDFHVFLVRGNVEVSSPSAKPVALKQKAFIFKDQTIFVKEKSEITLSDKNKNFYVLRIPGVYQAKDLIKINNYRVPGVTEKYLTLVWNELFNTHHDYSKFTKSNVAGVYGGVSRGIDCNNLLFPIADLKTSEDSLHFIWIKTSPKSNYTFSIYDREGKELVNRKVVDTQLILSLKKELKLEPGNYYWKIKGEEAACEDDVPVSFEILSRENEQKALDLIVSDFHGNDLPSQFASIEKLEKAGLITGARQYFQSLLSDNDTDKAFVKSYILFLLKYHYTEEASLLWQKFIFN